MSQSSPTLNASLLAAKRLGLKVRIPEPDELFIDIDNDEDYEIFEENYEILRANLQVVDGVLASKKVAVSKSGLPNRHVVVKLGRPVLNPLERLLYQALLGSDRKHELLSYLALCGGHAAPTMFFEK